MEHSPYDKRGYPIVDVREGYGEWVRTYEQTVLDEMDLRLLERLHDGVIAVDQDEELVPRVQEISRELEGHTGLVDALKPRVDVGRSDQRPVW